MVMKFRTDTPQHLLGEFKALIEQKEQKGKIDTWEVHDGGFRHTSQNWQDKGLFKAYISDDKKYLEFRLVKYSDSFAFAYYHGHLLQAFIEHLSGKFQHSLYSDGRPKK
jgi:hypothetical protein